MKARMFVGFLVDNNDFWVTSRPDTLTCLNGHAQEHPVPFCGLCGLKFQRRVVKEPSELFQALAARLDLMAPQNTWERRFEQLWEREALAYVDSKVPGGCEGSVHMALGRYVGTVLRSTPAKELTIAAYPQLMEVFQDVHLLRDVLGKSSQFVHLFLSVHDE